MHNRACLVAALAAALTVAALAGPAIAATPQDGSADPAAQPSFPGPGASAQAKQSAYGRYCGAGAGAAHGRKAGERRTCLDAMARLGGGSIDSPSTACRSLKRKRSKGHKGSKAAYRHCVRAGARLLKDQAAAEDAAAAKQDQQDEAGDDPAQDPTGDPGGDDPGADPGDTP